MKLIILKLTLLISAIFVGLFLSGFIISSTHGTFLCKKKINGQTYVLRYDDKYEDITAYKRYFPYEEQRYGHFDTYVYKDAESIFEKIQVDIEIDESIEKQELIKHQNLINKYKCK